VLSHPVFTIQSIPPPALLAGLIGIQAGVRRHPPSGQEIHSRRLRIGNEAHEDSLVPDLPQQLEDGSVGIENSRKLDSPNVSPACRQSKKIRGTPRI